MLTTQQDPAITVWARLLRAHAAVTRSFNAQLVAEHGLTINDYEALLLLALAPEGRLRRVDLSGAVALTPSGVTRLLDGLERLALVEAVACPEDRRVSYAAITAAGRRKLEEASCTHLAAVRALLQERYDEAELAQLAALLGRLPGAAEAEASACTAPQPSAAA